MTSWRDTTSDEAQRTLDSLLNAVLPFAEQTLNRYGEMFPFGATAQRDGQLAMIATDPGLGEQPASEDVIDALYTGARGDRDACLAVAVVAPVRLTDGDAIRVDLEHAEGTALVVVAPYEHAAGQDIEIGRLGVAPGEARVWAE